MELWAPERLRVIGSVMERYSSHLKIGHRMRMGMEGDPCAVFRSSDESPCGTIESIDRGAEGRIDFTLKMDNTGEIRHLNNRSVSADEIWEVEPDYLGTFEESLSEENPNTSHLSTSGERENMDIGESFRGEVTNQMSELSNKISRLEESNEEYRNAIASTIRYIATDLLRTSRGEPVEFSHHYADRYDMAFPKKESSEFRGDASEEDKNSRPGETGNKKREGGVVEALRYTIEEDAALTDTGSS